MLEASCLGAGRSLGHTIPQMASVCPSAERSELAGGEIKSAFKSFVGLPFAGTLSGGQVTGELPL